MLVKTDAIIEQIKKYPILYHTEHPDFSNTELKNDTWEEIGAQFNLTGPELKGKWRNIRDGYNKHLRSIRTYPNDSTKIKHYVKWPWAPYMEYFKPFLSFTKNDVSYSENSVELNESDSQIDFVLINSDNIESNFNIVDKNLQIEIEKSDNGENSEPPTNDDDPLLAGRGRSRERKQCSSRKKIKLEDNEDIMDKRSEISNDIGFERLDSTEHLFLAIAKTIKTFPLPNQTLLKMKITQMVLEEELKFATE